MTATKSESLLVPLCTHSMPPAALTLHITVTGGDYLPAIARSELSIPVKECSDARGSIVMHACLQPPTPNPAHRCAQAAGGRAGRAHGGADRAAQGGGGAQRGLAHQERAPAVRARGLGLRAVAPGVSTPCPGYHAPAGAYSCHLLAWRPCTHCLIPGPPSRRPWGKPALPRPPRTCCCIQLPPVSLAPLHSLLDTSASMSSAGGEHSMHLWTYSTMYMSVITRVTRG